MIACFSMNYYYTLIIINGGMNQATGWVKRESEAQQKKVLLRGKQSALHLPEPENRGFNLRNWPWFRRGGSFRSSSALKELKTNTEEDLNKEIKRKRWFNLISKFRVSHK